ncbi:hypothetical protein GGR92_005257 [Spirosoma lacussanchae]|uniref:hypothetical protein n=1 Tax=Spirosoma lacussanchae TaxID=1884249 RepID=UPI00110824BF|nr:hypothetical protein [Spirosoma lacussanchae]
MENSQEIIANTPLHWDCKKKGPTLDEQKAELINWQISVKGKVEEVCRRLEETRAVTTKDITDLHKALVWMDDMKSQINCLTDQP